jgi:hypothetical protein
MQNRMVERTSSSVSGKNCKAIAQVMDNKAMKSRVGGNSPDENER